MHRYILTGTPGAGKTAILRQLEVDGNAVVEEAATDVIELNKASGRDELWTDPCFVDRIVALQRQRQVAAKPARTDCAFFDRSPVCTLALSRFAGITASRMLIDEVDRVVQDGVYERTVFFVRNQGFVEPTEARRISYADSLVFERIHEQTYRGLGFELVDVPAGPLADRVALVQQTVQRLQA